VDPTDDPTVTAGTARHSDAAIGSPGIGVAAIGRRTRPAVASAPRTRHAPAAIGRMRLAQATSAAARTKAACRSGSILAGWER
jgi:hypothetical protein